MSTSRSSGVDTVLNPWVMTKEILRRIEDEFRQYYALSDSCRFSSTWIVCKCRLPGAGITEKFFVFDCEG